LRKFDTDLVQTCLVDPRQADLLQVIDPALLGRRVRAARRAGGLTQSQLGGDDVTVSYISRIESGQRRPDGRVLVKLADRLGIPVDSLLADPGDDHEAALRIEVDFAELSLETGEPQAALERLDVALSEQLDGGPRELSQRARVLRARALEAVGDIDTAVAAWEGLLAEDPHGTHALTCGIALSRCHREAGDLGRAISVGEDLLRGLEERHLGGGDEAVQLTVTVAAAYFQRGDTHHAVRLCQKAITRAEETGSPQARASAYWNASVMELQQGMVAAAVPLAEKALALLGESRDSRNLARLRSQLGIMQMQLDPPALAEASRNLHDAQVAMTESSASVVDLVRNRIAIARAQLMGGETREARETAHRGYLDTKDVAPALAADALALEGQAAAAEGDDAQARALYKEAVLVMTGAGADRNAGQLWLELGALLESVGEVEASRDAYRSAAVAAGLYARHAAPAHVLR
jgi:transcriptional regulator with XRE-family HTH domain